MITLAAQHAGADRRLAGQVADSNVAEADQVLGGEGGAHHVIGADERVYAFLAEPVDEHVRRALVAQPRHGWVLQKRAGQDHAVDPAGRQAVQVSALALGDAVGVAEEHLVATRRRAVLDAAEQGSEEWVRNVWDDHSQHQCLAQLQPAGDAVGSILGLTEKGFDSSPSRHCDTQSGVVVGDARHGRGVHIGPGRELFERYRHGSQDCIDIRFARA